VWKLQVILFGAKKCMDSDLWYVRILIAMFGAVCTLRIWFWKQLFLAHFSENKKQSAVAIFYFLDQF